MSVKGYLVFVPFENVASYEFGGTPTTPGSMTRPDKATVATTPGHLAGPFEVLEVVNDFSPLADLIAREELGLPPDDTIASDIRPARLSADLTMADGRTVHVPVVEPLKEPASGGKTRILIPYPAGEAAGVVVSAAVTNADLGMTFRRDLGSGGSIQPGLYLTVEFGEDSLDAGDIARVFGEWP
jgi:hypothetical protein